MFTTVLTLAAVLASGAPNEVRFIGYIDRAAVDRFEASLHREGVDTVVLRSPGGIDLEAIRAGNIILDHGLNVRVEEYCISACASFMLPAGGRRIIEPNAIVSWHLTAATTCLLLECRSTRNPDRRRLLTYLEPSLALYRRANVDPRIFTDQITAHDALCYLSRERDGRIEYSIRVGYEHWVPSRRYMDAIGLDVEGDWPSWDDIGARFQRHFGVIPRHYQGGEQEFFDTERPETIEPCGI
jgi:hypothetical protein